jgi:hypothetical protein
VLRIPSLTFVFILSLILIGVLQYASNKLPHSSKSRKQLDDVKAQVSSILERRQLSVGLTTSTSGSESDTTTSTSTSSEPGTRIQPTTSVYVGVDSTSTIHLTYSTKANEDYVPPATTVTFVSTAPNGVIVTKTSASQYPNVMTTMSAYNPTLRTESTTEVGTRTSTFVTTDAAGSAITVTSAVAFTTMRAVATTAANQDNGDLERVVVITWPLWKVFVGGYLPVLLAIIYKFFWTAIYAKVKLIEPFTLLSRPQGTVAADSLHTYYLSSNLTPDPIIAFFKGHWLIFWTSVVYVVVGLLAPVASEVLLLDTNYCEHPNLEKTENPCWPPRLSVDPLLVRVLQGLLGYIAVMTITVMAMVLRTSTGVYADPSSISTVASLMHHPEVLKDFRSLDDEALLKDIRKRLGDKRYKLQEYQRPDGVWRYGFVPVTPSISYDWTHTERALSGDGYSRGASIQRTWDWVLDISYFIFLLGILGVIIAYSKDSSDSAFNRFFNSNAFGPRFFMVCTGTLRSLSFFR